MKKILSILFIIILMGTTASADQHFEVLVSLPGSTEHTDMSFDLYEQEDQMIAVSTLFPEYAAAAKADQTNFMSVISAVLSLSTEQIADLLKTADCAFMMWLEQRLSIPEKGIYSGDLFPSANTRRTADFSLNEMIAFFRDDEDKYIPEPNPESNTPSILSTIAGWISENLKARNLTMSVQCYNQELFVSGRIIEDDQVIMTVSIDRSEEENRVLISYKEDGLYCYRELSVKYSQEQTDIRSDFRIASAASYQGAAATTPLFTEQTIITGGKIQPLTFRYILESVSLSQPLVIYGTATGQVNQASFTASAWIEGNEKQETFSFSAVLEPLNRPVSISDKTIINMSDEKENDVIPVTAALNAALLAAGFLPALPYDYQKMIMRLIYP